MKTFTIHPLQVGRLSFYRGRFTSDPKEMREKELFPILSFLLEGDGRKILVDTGGGDPDAEEMRESGHAPSFRAPDERPDRALLKIGVAPSEIDTVILTHLHWDHCYNNQFFPQADFYVQKAELLAAVCPQPQFQKMYESFETGLVPPWARQRTKWHVVDGDFPLCDGVKLLLLPGHSPGLQGVEVKTDNGLYLLASDAVPLYECVEGLQDGHYKRSALCADKAAFDATFARLRELERDGVQIVASHDFLTLQKFGGSENRL